MLPALVVSQAAISLSLFIITFACRSAQSGPRWRTRARLLLVPYYSGVEFEVCVGLMRLFFMFWLGESTQAPRYENADYTTSLILGRDLTFQHGQGEGDNLVTVFVGARG